jgi:pilus assembly protein FimV
MLEFNLGGLSLDWEDTLEPKESKNHAPAQETTPHEDPLATKLALAEEFSAIGDDDGARALIEEVIAEATGNMKAKAQRALSNL